MAIFKRPGSPFYQVEFVFRGRRVRESTGCISQREAQQYERRRRAEVAAEAGQPFKQTLTLDEAAGRYWIEHGQHLGWSKAVETYTRRLLADFKHDTRLGDIDTHLVASVVQRWRTDGDKPANINRRLAVLRGILRRADRLWAISTHSISWPDLKATEPKGRTRWITPAEAQTLIAKAHEDLAPAIIWSLTTGARKGETFSLTWTRVFEDRGFATVTGKTGEHTIWLTPEIRQLLAGCDRSRDLVFSARNLRRRWKAATDAAGITDYRWHDMRHTCATWMRQAGAPLEVVQRALGHSNITTTTRYAHVEDREVQQALASLPALTDSPANVVKLRKVE